MKFTITLITSLILLLPAIGQDRWEIVNVEIDSIPNWSGDKLEPIQGLIDVQFVDRDTGFFSGGRYGCFHCDYGILYKTEDGGKTWNCIFESVGDVFRSIHFVNGSKGFAEDNYYPNGLFTTTDGGYRWADTTIGQIHCIFFLNDSTGWACGGGKLYQTLNGGDNWNEVYFIPGFGIGSLYFIDEESGWATTSTWGRGDNGEIAKYTLSDGWKTFPVMTDLPLNKVFFIDRDHGWISGGHGNNVLNSVFMRTVDGGENWTEIPELNYRINDFYFETKNHGWAVGGGAILETFNGGLDWKVVRGWLPAKLNALHITDGVGWAVGDNGLILKCDSVATGIKEDNTIIGNNEPLFQNYPNPFQSSTMISYQLPAISYVELSVYDISGRKVSTLVNETQQPDRYELGWNADGMNPGVYFCELKTGLRRQVMKMILID